MIPIFDQVDLRDAEQVIEALEAGTAANRGAKCRRGAIDVVESGPGVRLVLTGDLHDNPLHMARVIRAAGLGGAVGGVEPDTKAHVTLHELIHGDKLNNGMDFSYRVLARTALLKSAFPEHVHVLLANHELAQAMRTTIVKDGVRVVEAFDEAIEYSFGERSDDVRRAVEEFVFSMPLALRVRRADGDILCAHSLPAPEVMHAFDMTIVERELKEEDYTPRRGSAHLMVWGRGHGADQLRMIGERWGVRLFVLGHEHADSGVMTLGSNALVLNSDHQRAVYLELDETTGLGLPEVLARVRPLA